MSPWTSGGWRSQKKKQEEKGKEGARTSIFFRVVPRLGLRHLEGEKGLTEVEKENDETQSQGRRWMGLFKTRGKEAARVHLLRPGSNWFSLNPHEKDEGSIVRGKSFAEKSVKAHEKWGETSAWIFFTTFGLMLVRSGEYSGGGANSPELTAQALGRGYSREKALLPGVGEIIHSS